MADILNKAYSSIQSLLTTELNAMADNINVLSAAIDMSDGTHGRMTRMDFELNLATADWSAQESPAIYLWLLKETDGTNYEDGNTTLTLSPARTPDEIIPLREISSAQRVSGTVLVNTPDNAKILIGNRSGQAFGATGNTLKYYINTNTVE
jgi:hypothetical protein